MNEGIWRSFENILQLSFQCDFMWTPLFSFRLGKSRKILSSKHVWSRYSSMRERWEDRQNGTKIVKETKLFVIMRDMILNGQRETSKKALECSYLDLLTSGHLPVYFILTDPFAIPNFPDSKHNNKWCLLGKGVKCCMKQSNSTDHEFKDERYFVSSLLRMFRLWLQ